MPGADARRAARTGADVQRPPGATMRRIAAAALALLCAGCADAFERVVANRVDPPPANAPAPLRMPVADLHADSIMWTRDLAERRRGQGHADLPRLADGGVVLQVFAVFTVTPLAFAACETRTADGHERQGCSSGRWPNMTALMNIFINGRPQEAFDIRRIVEARARAFDDLVRRSQTSHQPLIAIRSADDLRTLVTRRAAGERVMGAILALEGAHPLDADGDIEAEAAWLHGLGYRIVGLVHRFDNRFAGSSEGVRAYGLKPPGERLVQALQQRGMVVDVAHLASRAIEQVAQLARTSGRPLIYSHGGLSTLCRRDDQPAAPGLQDCDADRNLSPADAAAIARTGGVIGIGYWHEAVGSDSLASIVAAMVATRDALAAQGIADPIAHLAIGSDFDGFVRTAVDATGHPLVMGAIAASDRLGPDAARRIGWDNACRALARGLGGASVDTGFCAAMR